MAGTRQPRIQWTAEMRTALHLMANHFESISWANRTRIFNKLFAVYLRQLGFTSDVHCKCLMTQYGEITVPRRQHIWSPILAGPTTDAEVSAREKLADEISRVAQSLDIYLHRKGTSSRNAGAAQPSNPRLPTPRSSTRGRKPMSSNLSAATVHIPSEESSLHRAASPELCSPPTPRRSLADQHRRSAHSVDSEEAILFDAEPQSSSPFGIGAAPVTPPSTDTSSSGRRGLRRRRTVQDDDDDDDESDCEQTMRSPSGSASARAKRQRILPRTPQTPSSGEYRSFEGVVPDKRTFRARLRASEPRYPFEQATGRIIKLTQSQMKVAGDPDMPIPSEQQVYPPLSGLLFRYWDSRSQSALTDRGYFVSAHHRHMPREPPNFPSFDHAHFFIDEIQQHLDGSPITTRFISVSNSLAWVIRLGSEELKRGNLDGKIAVIDARALPRRNVLYAPPFMQVFREKFMMGNGAWKYPAKHEFLVYYKIPASVILHTVAVKDIYALAAPNSLVGTALCMNAMMDSRKEWDKTVVRMLHDKSTTWQSLEVIRAVAKLAALFGLRPDCPIHHLSHFICDVTKGWGFNVEPADLAVWAETASNFAAAITQATNSSSLGGGLFGIAALQNLKLGFLEGVRYGSGDFNCRHTDAKMAQMERKARRAGLESPAAILAAEMDAAKLHLFLFEAERKRALRGEAQKALLDPPGERAVDLRASGSRVVAAEEGDVFVFDED